MGYEAFGLSWDDRNQRIAEQRAAIVKARRATFDVCDVRHLDSRADVLSEFDVVICLEVIEHILKDQKLMIDMAACLKPGGILLLTTPNKNGPAIGPEHDDGPLSTLEDGGHVRRGYLDSDLRNLCEGAGLEVDEISYCSGYLSQRVTYLLRVTSQVNRIAGWAAVLPLRILPMFDPIGVRLSQWSGYSICLQAHKQKNI